MSRYFHVPRTLQEGDAPADRALISESDSVVAAPATDADGFATLSKKWLHLVVKMPDASTGLTLTMWVKDAASGEWAKFRDFGTDGDLALTDADSVYREVIDTKGVEKVAFQTSSLSGTFTTGYSVWASANTI